jgi:hypothetical protein
MFDALEMILVVGEWWGIVGRVVVVVGEFALGVRVVIGIEIGIDMIDVHVLAGVVELEVKGEIGIEEYCLRLIVVVVVVEIVDWARG